MADPCLCLRLCAEHCCQRQPQNHLYNCLMVSEWQTWGIFLSGVLAGLVWQNLCQHLARQAQLPPTVVGLARSLSGTSLVVGAGTA